MQIDLGTLLAIGAPCVGGIVWLVRLEGRVNVGDQRYSDIVHRLVRIEQKLDKSNGDSH